jgi:TonB family protein
MILYRVIAILYIVFFSVYSDDNLINIDTKIQECNDNNNSSACYELGAYYSKNNEDNSTNKMFYFFEKGCLNKHDESCIRETELIRKENKKSYDFYQAECNKVPRKDREHLFEFKCVPKIYGLKFKNVGDIYYNKNEYKMAYEQYVISSGYANTEAINMLSQMQLNGFGTEKNINAGIKYYIYYIRQIIQQYKFNFPKQSQMKKVTATIGITLMRDGNLKNIHIIESSNDDAIDQSILEMFKSFPKFHPIPKEYNMDTINLIIPFEFKP